MPPNGQPGELLVRRRCIAQDSVPLAQGPSLLHTCVRNKHQAGFPCAAPGTRSTF